MRGYHLLPEGNAVAPVEPHSSEIAGVWRALRTPGRFVAEFGGYGNVAKIKKALVDSLARRGLDGEAASPWYYPTVAEYSERLTRAGFRVRSIELIPRPTPLPGDIAACAKLMTNMPLLTAILDEVFAKEPMAHWYEVFNGVHVTFGAVRGPQEVIKDPQLRLNEIVVPLEGVGGKLTATISSPIQVHGVAKAAAKRGPTIGEHNQQVLEQLGFSAAEVAALRASGAVSDGKERAA